MCLISLKVLHIDSFSFSLTGEVFTNTTFPLMSKSKSMPLYTYTTEFVHHHLQIHGQRSRISIGIDSIVVFFHSVYVKGGIKNF